MTNIEERVAERIAIRREVAQLGPTEAELHTMINYLTGWTPDGVRRAVQLIKDDRAAKES